MPIAKAPVGSFLHPRRLPDRHTPHPCKENTTPVEHALYLYAWKPPAVQETPHRSFSVYSYVHFTYTHLHLFSALPSQHTYPHLFSTRLHHSSTHHHPDRPHPGGSPHSRLAISLTLILPYKCQSALSQDHRQCEACSTSSRLIHDPPNCHFFKNMCNSHYRDLFLPTLADDVLLFRTPISSVCEVGCAILIGHSRHSCSVVGRQL